MTEPSKRIDDPLFIVDNAEGGRSGIGYLREWCELATSFDIATGYFEIGALLKLDKDWQKLDKIRILMGDDVTHRTKKAMLEAVRSRAEQVIDEGLENDKRANPFLTGVLAVVEAMKAGQIECRVYNRDKFHAKAYITHGKFDVLGSQALVGSSNFTVPGLTQNVELNIKLESSSEVAQLQEWYERHWDDAVDVTDALVTTVTRHIHEYSPFDVYARALHELFADQQPSVSDWEQNKSEMFSRLDRYQQEAYWAMMKIARQHGGALLCDGVGLGKTFVGLMLIERLVMQERKKVVLFAPKAAKDAVWTPELHRYLSHVGGVGGSADFSNLTVFSHTDLTRPGDFPARFKRIAEQADAIVIDEAHHFRNPGKLGDTWEEMSRYHKLFEVLGSGPDGTKELFMLTATPINNSLDDFRHMVELFTQRDDAHFARTLGVNSVRSRVSTINKALQQRILEQEGAEIDPDVEAFLPEAAELLAADKLFSELVVQRSRAYARQSQIQETGNAAAFPVRSDPQVAAYSVKKTYGRLLDMVERAFENQKPLFALPIYYPLAYYKGPDDSIDPILENRQRQVVGLIRTNFLKRFESSVYSFERSCDRLMRKLLAFVTKNSSTPGEQQRYQRWLDQHDELLGYTRAHQLAFWTDEDESEDDEDVVSPELLDAAELLDPDEYDIAEILSETFLDLDQIAQFLDEARRFDPKKDDKLQKLIRLLKTKALDGRKVLIFTEFADTARYLRRHLVDAGIDGVFELDSGTKTNRADVLKRFSPYYNGSSSSALASAGLDEIRVLVATDVLSEGLNLQDATNLINYDIHWNPVRLMQRIGRVDRRLNPEIEEQLKADHPATAADRGKVQYWNFLPPDELKQILSLYTKVTHKTLLISETLGIEGKKLLTPEDDYKALRDFNASYEGETSRIEELHLEYQRLVDEHPGLEGRLNQFPGAVFSGRERSDGVPTGVFLCYRLPAMDNEAGEFTLEAGTTAWYYADAGDGTVLEDAAAIAKRIRSEPTDARCCTTVHDVLTTARDSVSKHIRDTYLKQLDVPVNAPNPKLICWMEVNEG